MTTLTDRPNTALLVIDVQNGVVAEAFERDRIVATIGETVAKARAAGTPVIWVQDEGEDRAGHGDSWEIVPELDPAAEEPRVQKSYGDSFEETELEDVLAERRVGRLVIAGAQTDACVRSTLHGSLVRGYDTILVSDAHTTEDLSEWGNPSPEQVIAHTNLYWRYHSAPGRDVGVVTAAELTFG